jgi:ATP-binding cassette, subfamily A (ABC1), member 3
MSVLGGLIGYTAASVTFSGGVARPSHGTIGIVPQKNVLFPELNCIQTLRVWSAVKRDDNWPAEDLEQLLRDCDLGNKIKHNADKLSGGQKRKLQLTIGLVGLWEVRKVRFSLVFWVVVDMRLLVVLVDEVSGMQSCIQSLFRAETLGKCTSGVDPLSRRALWRTLTSFRDERTIVFTTQVSISLSRFSFPSGYSLILISMRASFLTRRISWVTTSVCWRLREKLVAQGSPVALKSTLGQGYSVQTTFETLRDMVNEKDPQVMSRELLQSIRAITPEATVTSTAPHRAL